MLKELCANCDKACVNSKNNVGRTALHIASLMGHVEAAEVLLKHGAKVYIHSSLTMQLAKLTAHRGEDAGVYVDFLTREDGRSVTG